MGQKRKTVSFLGSVLLTASMLMPAAHSFAQAPGYNTNPSIEDVGAKLRAETLQEAQAAGKIDLSSADSAGAATTAAGTAAASTALTSADIGTTKKWLTSNDYTSRYQLTDFTLRAVGKYGEVWVANDLKYPDQDPRNSLVGITDQQVNYLLNEFDTNMYEKETTFFAPPKERKGDTGYKGWYKDDSGRTVILVHNIKDQSYYNPNYPSYIAGYFSSTVSDFSDRNVMTIDAFDWAKRTGANAPNPYLYEGVFAHEFQHLLHRDTDSGEENFINEGLSDFAQFLVGYGHSQRHVDFFMTHLRNSLTQWGDQTDLQILADYGNAYLFQLYLYEQFGKDFLQKEFKNQLHGIASINDELAKLRPQSINQRDGENRGDHGDSLDFSTVYGDYMTAIMVDGKYKDAGNKYKFERIDLKPDVAAASKLNTETPAWGTDFKTIIPDKKIDHLYFKGIDFLGTKWTTAQDAVKGTVLWGNQGDQADNHLIKELDLTGKTQATLSFDTKYFIEEQWDFGVVQVSEDGGKTWKSLGNADTRSDIVNNGYPTIKANLPGFTGDSNGWKNETFDLSAYVGEKILVDFRFMTDWGYNEPIGWLLSNLKLNDTVIDPMTSTAGFMSLEQATKTYVDYQIEFIGYKKEKGNANNLKVVRIDDPVNMKESDKVDLSDMVHSSDFEKVVMMVTYAAPAGKIGSVTYQYDLMLKNEQEKQNRKAEHDRQNGNH